MYSTVHLILSERTDVIEQCFLAANSAMFSTDVPMNVLLMLLCISKSQVTHQNILKPALVNDIIHLHKKHGKSASTKSGPNSTKWKVLP